MILKVIRDNFLIGEFFTPYQIHLLTEINLKTINMVLKKMQDKGKLQYYRGQYCLRNYE